MWATYKAPKDLVTAVIQFAQKLYITIVVVGKK
jgi:hypothetical protein